MKQSIQILCISVLMSVAWAGSSIYEIQDAIMQDMPAMIREQSLKDKQIINGCTVTSKLVTRQWAEAMHRERLKERMAEGKNYTLITISSGNREKKSLGGGTLVILYDSDTYECVDSYRTR